MTGDPQNLSGVWYGRYDANQWDEVNGFIALLEATGDSLNGTITERDTTGRAPLRRAIVVGSRTGQRVSFIKQYDGTGGHNHRIDYSGMVDSEGREITGTWHQRGASGNFTMQREIFRHEELEDEEEIELTIE